MPRWNNAEFLNVKACGTHSNHWLWQVKLELKRENKYPPCYIYSVDGTSKT